MMTRSQIAHRRLHNQHITGAGLEKPGDVVRWLGAVQAQDYLGSLWAVGLRTRGATESDVEQAVADKSIVRTWFMRGTLHFVPGPDLRWMLALMAPRMRMLVNNISRFNSLELDESTLVKSNTVIVDALRGGKRLTRREVATALEQAGIAASGTRLSLIVQRAQTDGLICYSARRDKQDTFALLDEWVPPASVLSHNEALAIFTGRYFRSHGPATLEDFVWWSGLTKTEARAGLEMAASQLISEVVDGRTYWFSPSTPDAMDSPGRVYLLPYYDEYAVGYRDRSAVLDGRFTHLTNPQGGSVVLSPIIVIGGRAVGNWKRTLTKGTVVIEERPFDRLSEAQTRAVRDAAERYGRFLGLPAVLQE